MSGSTVKNANNGELDALVLSDDIEDSAFLYMGYRTMANFSVEVVDIDPQDSSNVGFGLTTVYKLDLQGSYLGKIAREITMSAISNTSGSYTRFVDNIGMALSNEVVWKYGTRKLPTYNDHEIETYMLSKCASPEEQDSADVLLARNQSPAVRDILGASAQVLISDVPSWFDVDPRLYLHQHSLAQELQVRFVNRTLKTVLDHDGTEGGPVATFTEKLKCLFYHVSNKESNAQTSLEHQGRGRVKGIQTFQRVAQKAVPSSTTSIDVDISGLTNPSKGLFIIARKTTEANGAGGFGGTPVPNDFYNYIEIDTVKGTSSSGTWKETQTSAYDRHWMQPKLFIGRVGGHMRYLNHAFDPSDRVHYSGHLSHGNFNNPKLTLGWTVATPVAYVVDVFSIANEIIQEAQGDVKLIVD